MASRTNELGEFLRASRARLGPADAGLTGGRAGRRVNGLRREEVAVLAGVSADYYARLEQGRERNPSAQVMGAIGHALRLDPDAQGHLYRLAGLQPRPDRDAPLRVVHPALLQMLAGFPRAAAYVLGPAFDVVAANRIADALLAPFDELRSMPRILFTHPVARTVFAEWPRVARATVHALRLNAGSEQMIDVNLRGTLYGIAAVLPQMRRQGAGHVINIASTSGHRVDPTAAVYCATKFAVRALSEGLRQENSELRVTVVSPGFTRTELTLFGAPPKPRLQPAPQPSNWRSPRRPSPRPLPMPSISRRTSTSMS